MRIDQIHQFLSIAQTHSLTQSAAALYISPQGLSRSIAALEKECGMMLFERTTAGMILTDKGRRVAEHAQLVWDAYCDFEREVSRLSLDQAPSSESISLCVAPLVTLGDIFPSMLDEISMVFPGLEVNILERDSYSMLDEVDAMTDSRRLSTVMVATIPDYKMSDYVQNDQFDITVLRDFPMVARVAAGHPLADRRVVSCAELAHEKILCFNEPVIEDVVHHLLDKYGGPHFVFKGSIRNLVGRFPDAVSIAGQHSEGMMRDDIVSIPIRDTIHVRMVAVTMSPASAFMREIVECIARSVQK